MGDSVGVLIDGQRMGRPAGSPDDPGADAEDRLLPARLRRRLLLSGAALFVTLLALSAVVGQLRNHPIVGEGQAGTIAGIDPCPPALECAISEQTSIEMYDATYQAFPDYTQTSTTVIFDARTGTSYSQSMTLTYGGVVIRLAVSRDPGSVARPMLVDVAAASTDGVLVTATPADGGSDRIATVALSGPEDALLPVDAALVWAATVDLFGAAPR